jgi:glutathione S-transferase
VLTLHYFPGNASFAVHALLLELDVPFTLQLVDRGVNAHKSAAYLKLNPNGSIPVLVDGSLVLYETAAILLHLADTHPQAGLMPPLGTAERAHAYKWLMWMTNTVQATLLHYFYPERMVNAGDSAAAAQVKAHAEASVAACLRQLETLLAGPAGPWLLGRRFTLLDPFAWLLCRWTRGFGTQPARSLPNLAAYLQRVQERPALQRAIEREGLTPPLV